MLGKTLDYYLLKPFTHKKNYAVEADLSQKALKTKFKWEDGARYLSKIQTYFDNKIPISLNSGFSYLDIGCGMGRLSFGLSLAGAKNVTGIDIVERNIVQAQTISLKKTPDKIIKPKFIFSDIHDFDVNKKYDAIFVLGAMEHIHNPDHFLKKLAELLSPSGKAFVSHEPFQSPIGDHMHGFFKIQIPWRGVLFSEKAILRLRTECFRPSDPVDRYQDIEGGLNLMSFSKYNRHVSEAGLKFIFHNFNPQLWIHKKYRKFRLVSSLMTSIPGFRDYFITTAYSILSKK